MRATIVAGIGGLLVGHILWLAAISLATRTTTVGAWVLVIAVGCALLGVIGGALGWMFYRRKAFAKAAFLSGLPVSPVLLSLCLLAVTYL